MVRYKEHDRTGEKSGCNDGGGYDFYTDTAAGGKEKKR